jgi:hypothetical protein
MNTTDIINVYNKKIIAKEECKNLEELCDKYHKLYIDAIYKVDKANDELLKAASTYVFEIMEHALHTCGRDLKEKPSIEGFNEEACDVCDINESKRGFYILISKPRDDDDCRYRDGSISGYSYGDILFIRHWLVIQYGDRTDKKEITVCMKYHINDSMFELFCGDSPVNASEDDRYLASCEVYTVTKETKPISEDELVERLKNFILENTE